MNRQTTLRLRNRALVAMTLGAVIAVNYSHVSSGVQRASTFITEAQPAYKKANGEWSTVTLPAKFRINGIHSVLLSTGKVLVVAGSGNNTHHFDAGTFDTLLEAGWIVKEKEIYKNFDPQIEKAIEEFNAEMKTIAKKQLL